MTVACGSAAVLALALAIDAALGDPPNRWHPVAWLGTLIAAARRRLGRGSPSRLLLSGAAVTIGIVAIAVMASLLVLRVGTALGSAGIVVEAVALACCLSVRGLWRAAAGVAARLDQDDLAGARSALGFHLVSRPTLDLGAGEVAAAAVESVAENLTDSIVAPALMYLAFGLPGAAVYRAINTADAMIGYREGALEHFGKVAARVDDALNLIPARVAALGIVVAAAVTRASPRGAWAIVRRDHARTASPNAGWTMAAMAGALGVRLVKRDTYVLGDGALPVPSDIRRSLVVIVVALIFVLFQAALIAWLLC